MNKLTNKAGIKLLYFGNLSRIICEVVIIASTALAIKYLAEVEGELTNIQAAIGIALVIGSLGLILSLVAAIIGVFALREANKKCKSSYSLYLFALLVSIIAGFMGKFEYAVKAVSNVLEILAGLFLIKGVIEFIPETEKMGKTTILIYIISFSLSAVTLLLSNYLIGDITQVFNMLTPILQIVSFIFLVGFFKKANESLKKC